MQPRDALALTLTSVPAVRSGGSVVLTLRVGNPTAGVARLPLFASHGYAFDPVVQAADGREVWRRLPGRFAGTADELVLAPGAHAELTAVWDLRDRHGRPVPPGEYRVRGRLLREDGSALETGGALHPLRVLPA